MEDKRLFTHLMDVVLCASARGYFKETPSDTLVEKCEKAKAREIADLAYIRYYQDKPPDSSKSTAS